MAVDHQDRHDVTFLVVFLIQNAPSAPALTFSAPREMSRTSLAGVPAALLASPRRIGSKQHTQTHADCQTSYWQIAVKPWLKSTVPVMTPPAEIPQTCVNEEFGMSILLKIPLEYIK